MVVEIEPEERKIINFTYDQANDDFTFTWRSNPGDVTGFFWSQDLKYFFPDVNQAVPSAPSGNETTFGPVANPIPNADKIFFRLGDPDEESPTILAVSTNGGEVTVVYSEPLLTGTPDDLANYFLEGPGGATITITDVRIGDRPDQVILTLAEDLVFGSAYTLTVNNVGDPVGLSLIHI